MPVQTIADVDLSKKNVLVRVDFNVPLEGGKVADNSRIRAAVPTIDYLVKRAAKVILLSHLGRPKAQKNLKYSLRPTAQELSQLLGRPVIFLEDCLGDDVQGTIAEMEPGSVMMLENLRFYAEEEQNDREFAKKLAAYGNAFVNDAFGTAHRAHASTAGVPSLLPIKVAGFLMQKELEFLGNRTANPERPFTVILGGAKVSDKIGVIDALLDKCNNMLIGGAMAYTFHLAQGKKIGNSLAEKDRVADAKAALQKADKKGVKILLPVDSLATDTLNFETRTVGAIKTVSEDIPDGWQGVDIGPKTIQIFSDTIENSKTIFWNGPMGIFEVSACAQGTFAAAKAVARSKGISIVGGGDSITAINKSGFSDKIDFMSTGGGASLEFLEGKEMPGVAALSGGPHK
ncbi:MAG: phosphoglycerate kinase [Puniceicoccales bacterium]|jgi:3-phosphoglycerate kinase|nr:phosphoglycerate kinase [Puniceicoccales bacterium]